MKRCSAKELSEGVAGVLSAGVAQRCTLPYRGFAICKGCEIFERVVFADALPSATRRYGRVKICATWGGADDGAREWVPPWPGWENFLRAVTQGCALG